MFATLARIARACLRHITLPNQALNSMAYMAVLCLEMGSIYSHGVTVARQTLTL